MKPSPHRNRRSRDYISQLEADVKTFAAVLVGGVLGLVLLKFVLGPVLALLMLVVKLALLGALAYFIYALVRGRKRPHEEAL